MWNAVCINILCIYFVFVFHTEILMLNCFGWYWVWLLVMHNINMRIIISVLPDTKRVLRVKSCTSVYGLGALIQVVTFFNIDASEWTKSLSSQPKYFQNWRIDYCHSCVVIYSSNVDMQYKPVCTEIKKAHQCCVQYYLYL